jgi:hypothetical protein
LRLKNKILLERANLITNKIHQQHSNLLCDIKKSDYNIYIKNKKSNCNNNYYNNNNQFEINNINKTSNVNPMKNIDSNDKDISVEVNVISKDITRNNDTNDINNENNTNSNIFSQFQPVGNDDTLLSNFLNDDSDNEEIDDKNINKSNIKNIDTDSVNDNDYKRTKLIKNKKKTIENESFVINNNVKEKIMKIKDVDENDDELLQKELNNVTISNSSKVTDKIVRKKKNTSSNNNINNQFSTDEETNIKTVKKIKNKKVYI